MSEEYDQSKGGGQWGEEDGPNVRYDDFVGRIVRDPNEPPNVMLLSGYLGSSSEEGHVRLYLDEELGRYVEIPQKAIRHTQELPPEQSPLGGSLVWIDRDAEVVHGAAGSERSKATFLEGQIAQDYMRGGADYGVGVGGILPTDMGPGCGQSQFTLCIPQTEIGCRTKTGIFCTRFGPGCRRTIFEPACTNFGPNCRTIFVNQCQSIYYPCFTQNKFDCVESGFVPCNPPIDFTIYEQFDQQAGIAARAGGGGVGGPGGAGPIGTGFNCVSVFDNCATRESFCPSQIRPCPTDPLICITQQFPCRTNFNVPCPPPSRSGVRCPPTVLNPPCELVTAVNCPTFDPSCRTRLGPGCLVSRVAICTDTRTGPACEVGTIDCPTRDVRCRISQVVACNITRSGCEVVSVACGFDPQRGGGAQQQGFEAQAFMAQPTQSPDCFAARGPGGIQPSQFVRCPSAVDACPTRINCPSRYSPCLSQYVRCPSALDACPTRYNCPTLPNGCPGYTRFGACETFGPCPSAVDACPSRFGCNDVSQFGCQQTQGCFPEGGGGGFDPGGFGGGGGGGFGGGF